MKNLSLLIVILAVCFRMSAQSIDENAIAEQYIVQLKGDVVALDLFTNIYGISSFQCLSQSMNIWLVKSDAKNLLADIQKNPAVKVAQYNHRNVTRRSLVPNDPLFGNQWNMLNTNTAGADISATLAWQINHSAFTQMGDTIVIAVIDGSFDLHHHDLNFFVNHHEIPNNGIDDDGNGYIDDYLGWNVFDNNDSVGIFDSTDRHGTHVAGIAAAKGNNSIGVAGVCWGVKVLAVNGSSDQESDVVHAYDYVLEMRRLYDQTAGAKGAFVVATNSSFGVNYMGNGYGANPASYPIWCAMYDSLGRYGILSAVAAPNANVNVDVVNDVPTGCASKWMIGVTNTTRNDTRNGAAAFGPATVDIGAPGTYIQSTVPNNNYGYDLGTSMATPHITGAVAALMANACPNLLQDYFAYPDSVALILKDYILRSADPLPSLSNMVVSNGRLNLYHAFLMEGDYNCNHCQFGLRMAKTPITCADSNDASLTIAAVHPGLGYHYLWSTGDTTPAVHGLSSGFYQVTVTDIQGCQRQQSIVVAAPRPLIINSIHIIPIGASTPGNVIITASAGFDSLWYAMDTGAYQVSGIFITDTPGIHHLFVKNQSGCVRDTFIGIYHTGIEEVNDISFMKFSPNPASCAGTLLIRSDRAMDAMLSVSDLSGRIIYTEHIQITNGISQRTIDISGLNSGLYLLSLSTETGVQRNIKISVIN